MQIEIIKAMARGTAREMGCTTRFIIGGARVEGREYAVNAVVEMMVATGFFKIESDEAIAGSATLTYTDKK